MKSLPIFAFSFGCTPQTIICQILILKNVLSAQSHFVNMCIFACHSVFSSLTVVHQGHRFHIAIHSDVSFWH